MVGIFIALLGRFQFLFHHLGFHVGTSFSTPFPFLIHFSLCSLVISNGTSYFKLLRPATEFGSFASLRFANSLKKNQNDSYKFSTFFSNSATGRRSLKALRSAAQFSKQSERNEGLCEARRKKPTTFKMILCFLSLQTPQPLLYYGVWVLCYAPLRKFPQ